MQRLGAQTGAYPNVAGLAHPGNHPMGPTLRFRLFNFAVGKADLLPDHRFFMEDVVAPFLRQLRIWYLPVVGHCSRTGSAQLNQKLSEQRCKAVKDYLNRLHPLMIYEFYEGEGEDQAERLGRADNTETGIDRAVSVIIQNKEARRTSPGLVDNYTREANLRYAFLSLT